MGSEKLGTAIRRGPVISPEAIRRFMPDWSASLTRSLTLKDGSKLVTLSDARGCLLAYFSTTTKDEALAHAIELLLKAAEKGSFRNRKVATDQVATVLAGRGLR